MNQKIWQLIAWLIHSVLSFQQKHPISTRRSRGNKSRRLPTRELRSDHILSLIRYWLESIATGFVTSSWAPGRDWNRCSRERLICSAIQTVTGATASDAKWRALDIDAQ